MGVFRLSKPINSARCLSYPRRCLDRFVHTRPVAGHRPGERVADPEYTPTYIWFPSKVIIPDQNNNWTMNIEASLNNYIKWLKYESNGIDEYNILLS